MSNRFFVDLAYSTPVRFDMAKFMRYSDNSDPLTSEFFDRLLKLKPSGVYTVSSEEHNPALVSFRVYENTQYWWILLYYNRLTSYRDILVGDTVQYPSLEDLENLLFELGAQS